MATKYTCKQCNKKLKSKVALRLHQSAHEGLKPYTCNTCQKCFRQSAHLSQHMRVHDRTFEPKKVKNDFCMFFFVFFSQNPKGKDHTSASEFDRNLVMNQQIMKG